MGEEKIALITDSTNDLPQSMREQYGIIVVPMTVIWGDKQYLDGKELTAEEFYKELKFNPIHPNTSQPTPGYFLAAYDHANSG
jgi:DegV family protein with EDD domain